eukprot:6201671-Pleurochrysis_carterae.AAC.1
MRKSKVFAKEEHRHCTIHIIENTSTSVSALIFGHLGADSRADAESKGCRAQLSGVPPHARGGSQRACTCERRTFLLR